MTTERGSRRVRDNNIRISQHQTIKSRNRLYKNMSHHLLLWDDMRRMNFLSSSRDILCYKRKRNALSVKQCAVQPTNGIMDIFYIFSTECLNVLTFERARGGKIIIHSQLLLT